MLSKSVIQFSVDGWGYVPSLLFDLRPNYGGGNENNGDLLQKVPCSHCYTQCLQPCIRPPLTHASARHSWTIMGNSESVFCGAGWRGGIGGSECSSTCMGSFEGGRHKDLLSMALPIRTRPSFPLSQCLPSGSFHKPLILLHQRADKMETTIPEN